MKLRLKRAPAIWLAMLVKFSTCDDSTKPIRKAGRE